MKEERKTQLITIRCTEKEKNIIKRKADEKNKSVGVFILDSAMADLERRSCKEKRRLIGMIEKQERLNEIMKRIQESDLSLEEAVRLIMDMVEEEKRVWLN